MVAFIKAGVELAFETMVEAGIKEESAYYESLHELPLIANLVSRKKLYEMNIGRKNVLAYILGFYIIKNKKINQTRFQDVIKNILPELDNENVKPPRIN